MQVASFLPSTISPSTPATAGVPASATDPAGASFETILAANGGGTPPANAEPVLPAAPAAAAPVSEDWHDALADAAAPEPEEAVMNALSMATQAAAAAATPLPVPEPEEPLPTDTPVAAEPPPSRDEPDTPAPADASVAPAEGEACVPEHRAGHGRALGHTKGKHHGGHASERRAAPLPTDAAAVPQVQSTDPVITAFGPTAATAEAAAVATETADRSVAVDEARPPAPSPRASLVRADREFPDTARGPEIAPARGVGLAKTEPAPRPAAVLGAGGTTAATPASDLSPTFGAADEDGALTATPAAAAAMGDGSENSGTSVPWAAADLPGAKPGPRRDEPLTDRAAERPAAAARTFDTPAGWRVGLTMQRLREGGGERMTAATAVTTPNGGAAPANAMTTAPTLAQVLVEQRTAATPAGAPAGTQTAAEIVRASATPAAMRPNEGTVAGVAQQPAAGLRSVQTGEATAAPTDGGETPETEGCAPGAAPTGRPTQKSTARENFADTTGPRSRTMGSTVANDRSRNFLDVEKHEVGERRAAVGTFAAKEPQPMTASSQVLPHETVTSLEVAGTAAIGGRDAAPASPILRPSAEAAARTSAAVAVRETVEAAEQMREADRHSVDLVLETPSAEKLRVHLRWHDGVVQAKFVAQSTELQQALAREWEHAAPRLAERTVKFGEPSFERHDQSGQPGAQSAFSFEQQRQSSRGREQPAAFGDELGFALSSVRGANRAAVAARTVSTNQSPPTPRAADTRNLSAWA